MGYVLEADAMTKLTLSAEPEVVASAKRLAKEHKISVSRLFAQFVRGMEMRDWKSQPIGPRTRAVSGIVSLPPGKSYREIVDEAMEERHGKLK
jgi:hypothetical protein